MRVHAALQSHPQRVEIPFPHMTARAHLAHYQFRGRDGDLLIGARGAIIQSECRIDQQDVEPEETEDWPSARQQKHYSGGKANAAEREHDQKKSAATQRSVWREHRRKDGSLMGRIVVGIHGAQYRGAMARKTTPARRK